MSDFFGEDSGFRIRASWKKWPDSPQRLTDTPQLESNLALARRKKSRRRQRSSEIRGHVAGRCLNRSLFQALMGWLVSDVRLFTGDSFHGNIKWMPHELARQATIWARQDTKNVTHAFAVTMEICRDLGMKHIAGSYTSFMNALCRYQQVFSRRLNQRIQSLAKEIGGRFWRDGGWVLMGFDGSRTTTPRTVSNEKESCAGHYGQGKIAKYRRKKTKGMRRRKNEKNKPQPQAPQVWITRMWMLTSVLEGKRLPHREIIRYYRMRWAIELEYRGLKQTLDKCNRRCHNSECVYVVLDWSIRAMAIAEWMALRQQIPQEGRCPPAEGSNYDTRKRSLANTMRALRKCMRHWNKYAAPHVNVLQVLSTAIVQEYHNRAKKTSRYRPPNPDKKPLGQPKVAKPTRQQRRLLQSITKTAA